MSDKFILDVCCGGRQFWFNKTHPHAIYIDNRQALKGHNWFRLNHEVMPDYIMDFRELKFPNNHFKLVVFDPPHVICSEKSVIKKQYGSLDKESWRTDLKQGFNECWRVLDNFGVLIFKWSDVQFKKREVLELFDREPLFGHHTRSKHKTHWLCFMKL